MYANITVERNGVHNLAAELQAAGTRVQRYGPPVVRSNAKDLRDAVRRHAEGRPGPNKITGEYWKSIQYHSGVTGNTYSSQTGRISRGFEAEVFTDKPFGRRLELGFVGVDSLGRHYNQPPFPHWGPAIEEIDHKFFMEMEYVIDSAFIRGRR